LCNVQVLKDTNVIALTMLSLVVLSIIGLGALIHFKVKAGIWLVIIGLFMLVMSNVSWVGGIAFIIEGIGLALDAYIIQPLLIKEKIKELEADGKSVTYTKEIQ
jgi:uncharacterized membrane protein YpjA